MEAINEALLFIEDEKKEIVTIKSEFNNLNHIKKLEILFTIKNWLTDEFNKIANT